MEKFETAYLVAIVQEHDRLAYPMERRYEGDTHTLDSEMTRQGLRHDVVSKLIIASLAMRELLARGVEVRKGN